MWTNLQRGGREKRASAAGRRTKRSGVAAVLAMLYMALLSVLALGFYATVSVSAQLAGNERRSAQAQSAAESGVAFLRYHLARVSIPPSLPPENVFEELYMQLAGGLDGTDNLGGRLVGYVPAEINIPDGRDQYIQLEPSGPRFRATVTQAAGGGVRAKVTSADASGRHARAVQIDFVRKESPSRVFEYGVATNGPVSLSKAFIKGSPAALADVLSTAPLSSPVSLSGGTATIDGKVYLSNPTGAVTGDGIIAGISDKVLRNANVHPNTEAPEFPGVDPTPFVNYMRGKETLVTGNTSATYMKNIRIRAGANPTLGGSPTIEGVILIEAPNVVTFSGKNGTTIRGVIVVVNPWEGSATNKIDFTGGTAMHGPETLDDSFGELKTMTGSSILAPNFAVDMNGGSSSFGGTIIAKSLVLSGGSGGTVAGNVVLTGTSTLSLTGGSTINVTAPATSARPAGVVFSHSYVPQQGSYLEVLP